MGNSKSRNKTIAPEIIEKRNPIITNKVEVKSKEKCPSCNRTGRDFSVVSRDGSTYTNMYYCHTCYISWKD